MSARTEPLFTADRTATPFLLRLWKQKGGTQPIQALAELLEADGSATLFFRSLWQRAMADRPTLPFGQLATKDGLGTDEFWDVLA